MNRDATCVAVEFDENAPKYTHTYSLILSAVLLVGACANVGRCKNPQNYARQVSLFQSRQLVTFSVVIPKSSPEKLQIIDGLGAPCKLPSILILFRSNSCLGGTHRYLTPVRFSPSIMTSPRLSPTRSIHWPFAAADLPLWGRYIGGRGRNFVE